jgi:Ca2+-binding RTX toxin-like protein
VEITLTDSDNTTNTASVTIQTPADPSPPTIGNLNLDVVSTVANQAVRLDLGRDATVADLNGDLSYLDIFIWNATDDSDRLAIQEGDGLVVSDDNKIWIEHPNGDILIGTITASTGNSLRIDFTNAAALELVQRLIQALTYTTTNEPTSIVRKYIEIQLWDQGNDPAIANVDVLVAPSGIDVHVLTIGTNELLGTGNDDTFVTRSQDLTAGDQIVGGDGNDTLLLHEGDWFDLTRITFTGIETIAGSAYSDGIIISSEQLAGVTAIHGGDDDYNGLHLTGTSIDLTGKTITNITFIELKTNNAVITLGNEDLAKKVHGRTTQGDKLVLTTGTLDDTERLDLHRQGIETIVDGEGRSTTHIAPQIANLGGDRVSSTGRTPVLLDLGSNAMLSDDDGQFSELKVSVTSRTSPNDVFSLSSSSGVTVSQNGDIRIGDQSIASIYGGSEAASELTIHIYPTATEAQVQKLLQSLTYRHSAGALSQDLEIKIELTDVGGRTASHSVTVLASTDPGNTNVAPTNVRLNGDTTVSTPENTAFAAALSATDPDDTTLTFVFDTNAAGGSNAGGMFVIDTATKQLKLAPGRTLDFESAQSFTVYVKADDGRGGVSATQALTINVTDVAEVPTDQVLAGSSKADRLVGGDGNDRLAGKLGKDVLTGGAGQDRFVFDTKASKANMDKVTDFTTKQDKILLSDTVFKKLGKGTELKPGKIKKDMLAFGSKAKDKNDYLVQDKGGVLYYDADGSGRGAKVAIADFDRKISYADILII